jgi:hypothetical protein
MESTEKLLEKMDGAAFERFCGPVLRKMIPELANFIPSGINAEGQTMKSLSDGFCFIDSDHMAIAHITTNGSDLRTKWLYDGSAKTIVKGDLVKGIEQAKKLYTNDTATQFSIYLISNRRVEDDLHTKVHQLNKDVYITVKIIEQRDLVFFLDHDAEGQYLRMHFLGINATRISKSLIREIAENNLLAYGRENYLKDAHLAQVSTLKILEERIASAKTTINLLTGDSGFGKSTLCFLKMSAVLENEGIVLRIKPSVIEHAQSIEDAIRLQLQGDYPQMYCQPADIGPLFRNAIVIIDDINKFHNTPALLDKIISWNGVKKAGDICVLCPVWPRNLDALDNKVKKSREYTVVSTGNLSFYDCRSIISHRSNSNFPQLTEQQVHALIFGTGFDPLLLDLSLGQIAETKQFSENVPGLAIKNFVSDNVQQLHHQHFFPVHLINESLAVLGQQMLKSRNMNPHIKEIETWLGRGSEELKIITVIAAQRQLFSFNEEGQCFFRHDRIRDHLLSVAVTLLFENVVINKDVLADPYYAEMIGAAFADMDTQKDSVEWFVQVNPLAVYIALKYLDGKSSGQMRSVVVDVIEGWRNSYAGKAIPKAITEAIASTLIRFDVPEIERITKGFPDSAELQLAKFRNGIWLSGVNFFSFFKYFYPESPTYWWRTILSHVKSTYSAEIIQHLRLHLPVRFSREGIKHAYTLAGFLKESQLVEALALSWKAYAEPQNYPPYLWAILSCFGTGDREVVMNALSYWSSVPKDTRQNKMKEEFYGNTIEGQIRVLDWNFSEEQQALLIELSEEVMLHEILALLFARIDHPTAFHVVLNIEMQRHTDSFSYGGRDDRWDRSRTRRRLSQDSLRYLLQAFSDPNGPATRRYQAWCYWTGNADPDIVLKQMQEMVDERDLLFEHAVLWRVRNHDHTALQNLVVCIRNKPWQIRVLADIWNDETHLFFKQWFDQQVDEKNEENIGYGMDLLAMLDNGDACQLLIHHWEQLKHLRGSIQTALFLSTTETIGVAEQEMNRLGFQKGKPLPYFYHGNIHGMYFSDEDGLTEQQRANLLLLGKHFGHLYMGYATEYKNRGERLTRRKLEILVPYLPLLDSFSIYQFALSCLRIGASDLCYKEFYPQIRDSFRKKLRLNEEELLLEIIIKYRELERDNEVHIDHWIEELEKLGVTNEMLSGALRAFSNKYRNTKALFIVSVILNELGTRKDIPIIESFEFDQKEEKRKAAYWQGSSIFLIKRRTLI